jgi:glycogen debranching enzyme
MILRTVVHPLEILYGGGVGLSCALDGTLRAEELHGLFAGDTRVLSTWRLTIGGYSFRLLARTRPGPSTAQWDMQNPTVRSPGGDLDEGLVHCRLRRRLFAALHDDLTITSFADRPMAIRLSLQVDADFADLFQVKARSTPPRLAVERIPRAGALSFVYARRGFQRALHVSFAATSGAPTFVGTQAVFDLVLEPRRPWRCCVEAVPELDGARLPFEGDPHAPDREPASDVVRAPAIGASPILSAPFERGCIDLDRLAFRHDADARFIAAGAPWFLALFGRDTLVTSLMAGLLGSWHARGALDALAASQARAPDDLRDAQPGKIAHELRHGELARFHAIPHTPYYGTHDAPALYVLALWNAFRWTGDRALLRAHLPTAEAALRWCDELGDEDGDGLLEYRPRGKMGYRNQGWKDAEDAIPHEDGAHAGHPIATVELQGYWFAARLAMAELLEREGERERAEALRAEARALRRRVEERFWMEEAGFYALALDGDKRLVASIGSNPGHLLWCGLPTPARAARVARRMLAPDLFSGYGVRTLSSAHRKYNPLSYQLGSVWPHDNALLAAGLARYGLRDEAARVWRGILDAAATFEQARLPELFCGFARDDGAPVPYERANVPQAWAAAAPILAAQIFLGLLPDVANGRCLVSPWLPEWLPRLSLDGIELGDGALEIAIARHGAETRVESARHPSLDVVVAGAPPPAPLWGAPWA